MSNAIVEYYNSGLSISQISSEVGVSSGKVRKILSDNGVTIKKRNDPKSVARFQEIVALRQNDLSLGEIGKRVGLTRERVRQILSSNGVDTSTHAGKNAIDTRNSNIVKDYISGMSAKDLSMKYDLKEQSIYSLLRKENVTLRSRRSVDKNEIDQKIIKDYLDNLITVKQIVLRYSLSNPNEVYRILHRNNISLRGRD